MNMLQEYGDELCFTPWCFRARVPYSNVVYLMIKHLLKSMTEPVTVCSQSNLAEKEPQNSHYKFPEPKVTSSHCASCLTSPNPPNLQFTMTHNREKWHIFTSEKLKTANDIFAFYKWLQTIDCQIWICIPHTQAAVSDLTCTHDDTHTHQNTQLLHKCVSSSSMPRLLMSSLRPSQTPLAIDHCGLASHTPLC